MMKECEIRNIDILNEYLTLVERDVKDFFNFRSFVRINCPGCGGDNFTEEFKKIGFQYVSCEDCSTLFTNPRPPYEVLKKFYLNSPSASFWINEFFKPMAESRRKKIFRPRAEQVNKIFNGNKRLTIGDVGAGFGLFLEELRNLSPDNDYIAIEPSLEMADICEEKGFEVKRACLEDISDMYGKFDCLAAFELVEHLFDPYAFLRRAFDLLKPGGYLFLTTLNCEGFDILLLWDKSKSVSPPHHLNFFNITSMKLLLKRVGFETAEISTPGELDWNIVDGTIKNEGVNVGRFWNLLAKKGTAECMEELQKWISENNLSSHMRVLLRKPNLQYGKSKNECYLKKT